MYILELYNLHEMKEYIPSSWILLFILIQVQIIFIYRMLDMDIKNTEDFIHEDIRTSTKHLTELEENINNFNTRLDTLEDTISNSFLFKKEHTEAVSDVLRLGKSLLSFTNDIKNTLSKET